MGRHRFPFIFAFLLLCWLGMQAVHETGHVIAACLVGTDVERVVLNPLTFSRTDCGPSDFRSVILWGGAAGGILLPAVLWGMGVCLRAPGTFLLRFFAGFCLIANGAYFGGDFSVTRPTDAGELISLGTSRVILVCFGLCATALGLFLWHGQARYFGWGPEAQPVSRRLHVIVWSLLAGILLLESF